MQYMYYIVISVINSRLQVCTGNGVYNDVLSVVTNDGHLLHEILKILKKTVGKMYYIFYDANIIM